MWVGDFLPCSVRELSGGADSRVLLTASTFAWCRYEQHATKIAARYSHPEIKFVGFGVWGFLIHPSSICVSAISAVSPSTPAPGDSSVIPAPGSSSSSFVDADC